MDDRGIHFARPCAPSDGAVTIAREVGNDLCSDSALAVVRPEAANDGGLVVSGGPMSSPFGGTGRPTSEESERRRMEFVRLVAAGTPLKDAARLSKINPLRALELIDSPEMRQLLAA